jgi:hypothetical protein
MYGDLLHYLQISDYQYIALQFEETDVLNTCFKLLKQEEWTMLKYQ